MDLLLFLLFWSSERCAIHTISEDLGGLHVFLTVAALISTVVICTNVPLSFLLVGFSLVIDMCALIAMLF